MFALLDFILHIDKYLDMLITNYGILTYAIVFAIIFLETGLVVTPFLPGDSLIFVLGAISALGSLNIFLTFFLLSAAAILGDSFNYWIGSYLGERFFYERRWIKPEYLARTKEFYKKYGGKTIIFARFVPIVRTIAPFVAGVGEMEYIKFLSYNVIGGIIWVALFLFGGYFFGGLPIVKSNLSIVIIFILLLSFLPPLAEYIKHKMRR